MTTLTHDGPAGSGDSPAGRAQAFLDSHQTPIDHLPPSRLMAELAEARRHMGSRRSRARRARGEAAVS